MKIARLLTGRPGTRGGGDGRGESEPRPGARGQRDGMPHPHQIPLSTAAIPGLEVTAAALPAERGGRGDFVDVFKAQRVFGVAWGDLSGNGPAVGPLVTAAKALLRANLVSHPAAGATAHRLSRILYHVFYEERSLAMVFATYEPEQRRLVLCNCGGWPPILLSGGHARPLGEMEPRLGDYDVWRYAPVAVTLSPGDTLVGFTAGLPESRRGGEILGTAPLRGVLERRRETELPALADELLQLSGGDSSHPHPSSVVALRVVEAGTRS